MAFCTKCGKELDEAAKFCGGCGNQIGVQMQEEKEWIKLAEKKKTGVGAILLNLVILFVLGGVGWYFLMTNPIALLVIIPLEFFLIRNIVKKITEMEKDYIAQLE
jgi:uncharacterized membrane protein YvbJ